MKTMFRALSLSLLLGLFAGSALADDGFQELFDGKSLEGWNGKPEFWSVEDGAITGQTTKENPTKGNTFLIWEGGELGDFELRVKFRIFGGNSGIQYRSKHLGNNVVGGYQADFEAGDKWTGILYDEKGRGVLAQRGQKVEIGPDGKKNAVGKINEPSDIQDAFKKEDWNEYVITAKGNHITQELNGEPTIELIDNQESEREMSGILALQLHAGPPMKVQFKDIRLKKLGDAASDAKSNESAEAPGNSGESKKVVFVAGKPSHGRGAHEHNAGCLLMAKQLNKHMPELEVDVHRNGWPANPDEAFADADTIVIYCDGGGRHVVLPHAEEFDKLMDKGVGLVCIHYAVEVPKGEPGERFVDWLGGYFEPHWSVNPHWKANFDELPEHPITRGVKPFTVNDEWYYHMRFRDEMKGVTPILTDLPPKETLSRRDGAHSGNPHVRAAVLERNEPQHVAWATEREDGGRAFGFTGGHFHRNWGDDNFRRLVLNAIAWTAGADVPKGGVESSVTADDLEQNLD